MHENTLLQVEIQTIKAKFDMIAAKYANIEAEKQELEEKLVLSKSNPREKATIPPQKPPFPP